MLGMGMSRERAEAQALAVLTGPRAGEGLQAFYAGTGTVIRWNVNSVNHRPGAGVTVGYRVGLSEGAGIPGAGGVPAAANSGAANAGQAPSAGAPDSVQAPSAGRIAPRQSVHEKYVCASTARLSHPHLPTVSHLTVEGLRVAVWEHPNDPELPALPLLCSPRQMSEFLGRDATVELKSYRPTRRAVARVVTEGEDAFAKVLRPPAAASLAKRHRILLRAGVKAPAILAQDERGLVLISRIAGTPLANALGRGLLVRARPVLEALETTLNRLPAASLTLTRKPAWSERVSHYANAAATALPEIRDRAKAVAAGVEEILATVPPGPLQPVHGDFYEANIFLTENEGRFSAGIIDVDSLGPGYRVDDWACLLGHVSVLPHLAPASYPHVRHDLETWCRILEYRVPPAALYGRCAGVVLSLVAGAARVDGGPGKEDALGRLGEAENWLRRAYSFMPGRH